MPNAAIELKTPVPGPNSVSLMKRREAAVPRGPYHNLPIFLQEASGATVTDVDGNRFLDFAGGLGCLNVGNAPASVVEAIRQQAGKSLHGCFHVAPGESYVALAERLNALVPISGPKKTFFANTGAEAVENAVKCARAFTGRPGVIVFEDAFHGRTHLTMTMTSKVVPYKQGFGPFASEVYRTPYAYCYRCPYSKEYPGCEMACADQFDKFFRRYVDPASIAAIVVEPVLGEGGFVVPPTEFLQTLRQLATKHGIVLVADEVQSGIARTGKLFACEKLGLDPDILITAKSLAAGMPLSSITGRAPIMDAALPGGLGTTYGGNPVSCAAALAVLDLVERDGLCARAEVIGNRVTRWARDLAASAPLIGDVRNLGAMIGLELVTDRQKRTPAKEKTQAVQKYCYEHGLLILTAGTFGNVIRMLMPLVMTDAELDEALEVLGAGLRGAA
ncbi:MAG: 4-aminobutyrate--2-oxoglutarate transaminase [Candidatus Wallbacteria bacterium]|nr:4-aminobutyrate--2-oxoglutarate transaminase [Candidatus Wallbacteria bacterium]